MVDACMLLVDKYINVGLTLAAGAAASMIICTFCAALCSTCLLTESHLKDCFFLDKSQQLRPLIDKWIEWQALQCKTMCCEGCCAQHVDNVTPQLLYQSVAAFSMQREQVWLHSDLEILC